MPEPGMRENEYVLAPGEYVYTSDQTSGKINTYVGPYKISLAGTDQPMIFDPTTQKYIRARTVSEAVKLFPYGDERAYIVLHNPATDDGMQNPKIGTSSSQAALKYGKRINIKGPSTFPLWPGQQAQVIQGHQLRSNQYLIVKVYNEEEARKNWSQSVMQPANPDAETKETPAPSFVTGQLLIIKGKEVSFYIPPTGIEVLTSDNGQYVRDAVTLERLEYCILLDESGDKRYVRGPSVVFPSPTEKFVELDGNRKFRALELNPQMGIHVKVIADYSEGDRTHKAGEELHITGETNKIYFPRAEHALIKYNDQIIQYAVAITSGEGRYVLDKTTGKVETIHGPNMFLPNPLNQVMVNRILSEKEVRLWFPGNEEAIQINRQLSASARETARSELNFMSSNSTGAAYYASATPTAAALSRRSIGASMMEDMESFAVAGDQLKRKSTYTPPRSITLDSKYEGAVRIDVWPGYAVQVVSKSGDRSVVIGPQTVILEYDETLEILSLSRGVPKNSDNLLRTPYLRVKNNQVTDIVGAVTKDLVDVSFKVSYRVNFEGDSEAWFSTENYVKLLTDHLRSMIRNAIKNVGIEEVNARHIEIIRDIVLGASIDGNRKGCTFEENGMVVYDVEIFNITIGDTDISHMLIENQHRTVQTTLEVAQRTVELDAKKKIETFTRQILELESESRMLELSIIEEQNRKKAEIDRAKLTAESEDQPIIDLIAEAKLKRISEEQGKRIELLEKEVAIKKAEIIDKIKAISPELEKAIQNAYSMNLAETVAASLPKAAGTLGLLTGAGGIAALVKLFEGTPIADAFAAMLQQKTQG